MGIKLTDSGRRKMQKALNKKAIRIVREAQKNSPVDTGRLRSSITFEEMDNGIGVRVGTNVQYAQFQEFGTENMPAQPFLRPAFKKVLNRE